MDIILDKIALAYKTTLFSLAKTMQETDSPYSAACCFTEMSIAMMFISDYLLFCNQKGNLRVQLFNSLKSLTLETGIPQNYILYDFLDAIEFDDLHRDRVGTYHRVLDGNISPIGLWYTGKREKEASFQFTLYFGDCIFIPYLTHEGITSGYNTVLYEDLTNNLPMPNALEAINFYNFFVGFVMHQFHMFSTEVDRISRKKIGKKIFQSKKSDFKKFFIVDTETGEVVGETDHI